VRAARRSARLNGLHNRVLEPGIHLLMKPFRKADLAAKLREILDAGE
jgi:hypothetical protein